MRIAHMASTVWFVLSVSYILISALRQAGIRWWVVFSLSGHGALIIFVLVSLYLLAIFRGISSSQKVHLEHPLTNTIHYALFYVSAPFLGSLAGLLGMIGSHSVSQFMLGIAMGTLGTTFLVWVIVDPAIGMLEMLLPISRRNRAQRLLQAKADKEKRQQDRLNLLEEVIAKEDTDKLRWQQELRPQAEILAGLLTSDGEDPKLLEQEAVGIGVKAWQTGGISCMRELREMAISLSKQRQKNKDIVDYISFWWDGIGNWRATPIA